MDEYVVSPKRRKIEDGDDTWRKSVFSFPHLCRTMFEKQIDTDVTFKVGLGNNSEEIKCHEFILLAHSPVLKAKMREQWTGDVNKGSQKVIALTDDNPQHFHFFVKMMYWNWSKQTYEMYIIPKNVTPEIAVGVLSLAYKYSAGFIIRLAEHFVHSYLKLGLAMNMAKLYTLLRCLPISGVGQDARKNFRTVENCLLGNGENVFSSDAILELNQSDLVCIVKQNELRCPEGIVFSGCLKWAQEQCKLKQKSATGRRLRSILEDIIQFIRFPIMDIDTWTCLVLREQILTDEEVGEISIYRAYKNSPLARGKMPIRFPFEGRVSADTFQLRRLDAETVSEQLMDFSSPHGFVMTLSKKMKLSALGFYNGKRTTKKHTFHVELEVRRKTFIHEIKDLNYGSRGKDIIIILGIQPEIKIPAYTPVNIKFTITVSF